MAKFNIFKGVSGIAAVFLLVATALTVANVFSRYILQNSIYGSEEAATFMILVMTFLVYPILEASDDHLCIGLFENIVKNKVIINIVYILRGIVTAGIAGVFVYYGYKVTALAHQYNTVTSTLHIPREILYGIMTAAFLSIIIILLFKVILRRRILE